MRSFSPGAVAVHHCSIEVGGYAGPANKASGFRGFERATLSAAFDTRLSLVRLSVCHTLELRLNSSRYRIMLYTIP